MIRYLLAFVMLPCCLLSQAVNDFSIPYKDLAGRPAILKNWAAVATSLWGTDSLKAPVSITVGSGLVLSGNTLSVSFTGYQSTAGVLALGGFSSVSGTMQDANIASAASWNARLTRAAADDIYEPIIGAGTLALAKLATDPLARANHTGTQAFSTLTDIPTTLAGIGIGVASQAEAEAGTDNTKAMTPQRTAEAIAALAGGGTQTLPRGHIAGLTLSWISSTVIQISAGAARDSTNAYDISTPLTGFTNLQKSTSAWAQTAFSGATGGMSSTANSDTLYAVFVIYNPGTDTMDGFLSTSPTAPATLPSGYTIFRRIGYVRTAAGSATFLPFQQHGDWFTFDSGHAVSPSMTLSTTVADYTITGPPARCLVDLAFSTNPVTNIYLTNGVGLISGTSNNDYNATAGRNSGSSGHVLMPFGAGIRVRADAFSGTPALYLTVRGWMDHRGRHD